MGRARDRWLNEGVQVLTEEGAPGLRIDRLAARLGLSKGSFHHHFAGAEGFKRDLLAHIERLSADALEDVMSDLGAHEDPETALELLTSVFEERGAEIYRPELDAALRAWERTDPEAAEIQRRIDDARLSALQSVWRPYVGSDAEARRAAQLPYLLVVGAMGVTPPVEIGELRELLEMLLPLVPGLRGPDRSSAAE